MSPLLTKDSEGPDNIQYILLQPHTYLRLDDVEDRLWDRAENALDWSINLGFPQGLYVNIDGRYRYRHTELREWLQFIRPDILYFIESNNINVDALTEEDASFYNAPIGSSCGQQTWEGLALLCGVVFA